MSSHTCNVELMSNRTQTHTADISRPRRSPSQRKCCFNRPPSTCVEWSPLGDRKKQKGKNVFQDVFVQKKTQRHQKMPMPKSANVKNTRQSSVCVGEPFLNIEQHYSFHSTDRANLLQVISTSHRASFPHIGSVVMMERSRVTTILFKSIPTQHLPRGVRPRKT